VTQGNSRNDHLRKHREDLKGAIKGMHRPVRLLALNWSLDRPYAEIHRICSDRILTRGANHQTLHGDTTDKSHEDVVWMFLRGTEPLNEYEADATIEMEIGEDLEHSLARAIDGIVRELGLPRPDPERVGAALSKVRGYKPAHTTSHKKPETKAKPAPRKRKTIYTDDHHQDKKRQKGHQIDRHDMETSIQESRNPTPKLAPRS